MKRILIFISAFSGSVAAAFLMLLGMAWLVTSVTPAHAQVVERQRSTTTSEERSKTDQQQGTANQARRWVKTYTPGALFFADLARVEAEGERQIALAGGRGKDLNPQLPAAWLMSLGCQVIGGRRYVYGQTPNSQFTMSMKHVGGGVMIDGAAAAADSNTAWTNAAGEAALGEPLWAQHYTACVAAYAQVIQIALESLARKGRVRDGIVYVPELQAAATKELDAAINGLHFSPATVSSQIRIPLAYRTPCLLPTPNSISAGSTTFSCASWRVSQRPLEAVEDGRVLLSETTVAGTTYQFADASELASAQSTTRAKSRSDAKTRGEAEKVKVQK